MGGGEDKNSGGVEKIDLEVCWFANKIVRAHALRYNTSDDCARKFYSLHQQIIIYFST